ncbi:unnamed protein product [Sphenostylis stenocarpa]|uniref:Uncharacterized protein n=1 Tax=Sphenostylis stenocarpa TaxID=92480 RepID=A0AA86VVY3_9FABA|nr:unnamed protein product [Sphenostylis stenocarpa]
MCVMVEAGWLITNTTAGVGVCFSVFGFFEVWVLMKVGNGGRTRWILIRLNESRVPRHGGVWIHGHKFLWLGIDFLFKCSILCVAHSFCAPHSPPRQRLRALSPRLHRGYRNFGFRGTTSLVTLLIILSNQITLRGLLPQFIKF